MDWHAREITIRFHPRLIERGICHGRNVTSEATTQQQEHFLKGLHLGFFHTVSPMFFSPVLVSPVFRQLPPITLLPLLKKSTDPPLYESAIKLSKVLMPGDLDEEQTLP